MSLSSKIGTWLVVNAFIAEILFVDACEKPEHVQFRLTQNQEKDVRNHALLIENEACF